MKELRKIAREISSAVNEKVMFLFRPNVKYNRKYENYYITDSDMNKYERQIKDLQKKIKAEFLNAEFSDWEDIFDEMDASYDELETDDISFSFKVSGDFDKKQIKEIVSLAKKSIWDSEIL